ncbi:MAG: hypothetical protein ACKERG_03775 [Candidatus Hodgkinia cicadicola]
MSCGGGGRLAERCKVGAEGKSRQVCVWIHEESMVCGWCGEMRMDADGRVGSSMCGGEERRGGDREGVWVRDGEEKRAWEENETHESGEETHKVEKEVRKERGKTHPHPLRR